MNPDWINRLSTHEKWLLILFFLIKLSLVFTLPLTGDEAYFIQWGKELALGYYDHPPVVGWTIWGLSFFSESLYFYRLFAFVSSIIVAIIIYRLALRVTHKNSAIMVSLAYLISPISLFSVLLANDVVLTFFGVLGFYYYVTASEKNSLPLAVISGVFLGLTFLSKYLSAMFFIGIFLYSLVNAKKVNWKVSLVCSIFVLVAIGENLYFNLQNCWNNILFNLVSRTRSSGIEPKSLVMFFVTMAILISPMAIAHLIRHRVVSEHPVIRQALYICVTFILVFMLVSISKTVGLHWFALMIPFAFILLSQVSENQKQILYKYSGYISLAIGMLLLSLVIFSQQIFDFKRKHKDVAFYLKAEEICKQLPQGETIFTRGYSNNSVLAYYCKGNRFHVAFDLSKYGREDDKRVNFKQFDGKSVWFFDKDDEIIDRVSGYVGRIETKTIRVGKETTFILVKGENFNYSKYREHILTPICEQYYTEPGWLPVGKCNFKEKYNLKSEK
ncbi:glycosyltransferase family 39 protein [Aliikangiella sp. G2MR2-5]|uniref:ArnT family glycosyltransferase n=1 Tax=Aliikangiella sp. G2MR2-5 TaxID=2788943 RepID=UPI0018ABB81C|nr:glycosyltransferase family 39 protein [Aliikangiella sp. G2MR2-5]